MVHENETVCLSLRENVLNCERNVLEIYLPLTPVHARPVAHGPLHPLADEHPAIHVIVAVIPQQTGGVGAIQGCRELCLRLGQKH